MSRPIVWHALRGSEMRAALVAPVVARTAHFSLQHVSARPPESPDTRVLSTADAPIGDRSVDNNPIPERHVLGFVLPKRLARRAVTRNLVRRQMRLHAQRRALPAGTWLLRLRTAVDPKAFPSAASPALRHAVSAELQQLFERAGWP